MSASAHISPQANLLIDVFEQLPEAEKHMVYETIGERCQIAEPKPAKKRPNAHQIRCMAARMAEEYNRKNSAKHGE